MISKFQPASSAFVWIWLPNETTPIVAGRIKERDGKCVFEYSTNYRHHPKAIALSPFELPLQEAVFVPQGMNVVHSCLRDAEPDAWGRRLIDHQYGLFGAHELDYMLLSGTNRIGGIDFQSSSETYCPRDNTDVTLNELLLMTDYIEKNKPLPKELEPALLHGTSIGGARPKALIRDKETGKEYIAKFSLSTDRYNLIKAEYIAMQLAKIVGISVPAVHLKTILGKDVLFIERFDRILHEGQITRKLMLSALSLLGLNELEARYASYSDFAAVIRKSFLHSREELKELYRRLAFNVLIGNTDDHARNHSAFWDGQHLRLTPAYDLLPQMRSGFEATQAMAIEGIEGNLSKLKNILSVCEHFQLTQAVARSLMDEMIEAIRIHWPLVCDEAGLSRLERQRLWEQAVFNPFCFQGF